jgi:hypothetical protein
VEVSFDGTGPAANFDNAATCARAGDSDATSPKSVPAHRRGPFDSIALLAGTRSARAAARAARRDNIHALIRNHGDFGGTELEVLLGHLHGKGS